MNDMFPTTTSENRTNSSETLPPYGKLENKRTVTIAAIAGTIALVAIAAGCLLFIPGAPLAAMGAIIAGNAGSWLGMGELAATLLITGTATLPPSIIAAIAMAKRNLQLTSVSKETRSEVYQRTSDPEASVHQGPDTNTSQTPTEVDQEKAHEQIATEIVKEILDTVLSNQDNTSFVSAAAQSSPNKTDQSGSVPVVPTISEKHKILKTHFSIHSETYPEFYDLLFNKLFYIEQISSLDYSTTEKTLQFRVTFKTPAEGSIPETRSYNNVKLQRPLQLTGTIDFTSDEETTITLNEKSLTGSYTNLGFFGKTPMAPQTLTKLVINHSDKLRVTCHTTAGGAPLTSQWNEDELFPILQNLTWY
ncbi:MAG: hypothetical protein HW387_573 [Parachlamydiales bacterium]|nr:hypothetical protein [Parachlamydiales bacterium]